MNDIPELRNSNNKDIQINCVRDFAIGNVKYQIVAGEDGSIKVQGNNNETYLPYAVDSNGWLIEIDDVYMCERVIDNKIVKYIIVVSPAGVIAIYTKEEKVGATITNNNWNYEILKEDSECYYEIKEAHMNGPLLTLYINTEFSGTIQISFDLSLQ